ncbi:hypothetical protein ES702_07398 [subsurface metagenome]
MTQKTSSSKRLPTVKLPVELPGGVSKTLPWAAFYLSLHKHTIFKNGNRLRLFHELVASAPNYERTEPIDNEYIKLAPYQGVFSCSIFSYRLKIDRSTLALFMRQLKRAEYIRQYSYPHYTIYILTDKGIKKYPKLSTHSTVTPESPVELPVKLPYVKQSTVNSINNNIDKSRPKKVALKDYPIPFNTDDYQITKLTYKSFDHPCNKVDYSLPPVVKIWLITGVCIGNKKECEFASTRCLPHLEILANKLRKKLKKEPITNPRNYIRRAVNEFFHPELFYETKGGE